MTSQEHGVIVGTSRGQEWLLPWWWMHYSMHNSFPVTFVDFGDMSPEAIAWCLRKGTLIKLELSDAFMAKKETVDRERAALWESVHPRVWELRFEWFKKPFALDLSPYQRTVWLDVDCQVRGAIDALFTTDLGPASFGVVPEPEWQQESNRVRSVIIPGEVMYNAGVVAFERGSRIVDQWVKRAVTDNHLFWSDQQLMVSILHDERLSFCSLSPWYNWTIDRGHNSEAVIYHWWGGDAKKIIAKQIKFLNEEFFLNVSFRDSLGAGAQSHLYNF